MRLWNICLIALLFILSDAQHNSRRRQLESKDAWARETPSDNLIDIDLERNSVDQAWPEVSGNGVDSTDDEDLMTSGSGSGDRVPDPSDVDRPPTANAGPDVAIALPQNRVVLCGNLSFDDRHIISFQWIKKTSPLSADMMGTGSVCMQVSNMQLGDYAFTLVVTDSGGNKATDDVNVFVNQGVPQTTATPCQEMRETSKHMYGTFVPRCLDNGHYDSLQCRGHPGTTTCWCADLGGREIPGTAKDPPQIPDCDQGTNLPPCLFMLIRQLRGRLLGSFKPKCTLDGFYQSKQCSGSMCYCVHTESGVKIPNTEVIIPNSPVCDGSAVRTTPDKGLGKNEGKVNRTTTVTPQPEVTTRVTVNIDSGERETETQKPAVNKETKGSKVDQPSTAAHIMTQPGILAAIIGGSVVLLLCAVLLVMFVVYRMRKKDEGSYALDEPKKMPNYSYQRAPDKEFYA